MLLRYTSAGFMVILPEDDPRLIVNAMLETGYCEEFCVSPSFDPDFITRLMEAGFLVMSTALRDEPPGDEGDNEKYYVLLPKLHLVRSALFFENLHIKKSVKRYLNRYELRADSDFDYIIGRCVETHGGDWLTPPLVDAIKIIREKANGEADSMANSNVRPVSFALYRNGKPVAGEFGVRYGGVYTSYSGYYDESNAGTVQLILTARYLQDNGYSFFDLGMPLDYKTDLGATDISPGEFVRRFRAAHSPNQPFPAFPSPF
jgi:Leu/Phe-tRNA-protein transferase